MGLYSPIRYLKGVGENRAAEFAAKGIGTVRDLLYFFPRSYEDRSKIKQISECIEGETVCICAAVYNLPTDRYVRRNMLISSMQVFDESGMISLIWYNNNTFFSEKYHVPSRDGSRSLHPYTKKPEAKDLWARSSLYTRCQRDFRRK